MMGGDYLEESSGGDSPTVTRHPPIMLESQAKRREMGTQLSMPLKLLQAAVQWIQH